MGWGGVRGDGKWGGREGTSGTRREEWMDGLGGGRACSWDVAAGVVMVLAVASSGRHGRYGLGRRTNLRGTMRRRD